MTQVPREVENLRSPECAQSAAELRKAQAARLLLVRQRLYKTASAAARALGIAGPTYLAHENGTRQIRDVIAEKYAAELGTTPEYILLGIGKPSEGVLVPPESAALPSAPTEVGKLLANISGLGRTMEAAAPCLSQTDRAMISAAIGEWKKLLTPSS